MTQPEIEAVGGPPAEDAPRYDGELVDALAALMVRHGAKSVLDTAEALYRQTKEGKAEKTARDAQASEDRWEQKRQAAASRSGTGGRKNSSLEEARRLLGG